MKKAFYGFGERFKNNKGLDGRGQGERQKAALGSSVPLHSAIVSL